MNTKSWKFRSLVGASTVAATAAVALGATGLGGTVFAGGASSPSSSVAGLPTNAPAASPGAAAPNETLLGTYVESGSGGTLAAGTLTAIDPVNKITCPAGDSCTIVTSISIQMTASTDDAGDRYATAWQLDGAFTGELGPFLGDLPTDQDYQGATWTDKESGVTPGKHKVQAFGYVDDGAALGSWTVTYTLYS